MTKTFEDFLMEKHSEQHIGTKETLVDNFGDWLVELDVDDIIKHSDEYAEEMKKEIKKCIKKTAIRGMVYDGIRSRYILKIIDDL